MENAGLAALARRVAGRLSRRSMLGAGPLAVAAVTGLNMQNAGAKPSKNKRERCQKREQKCKREAAAHCARWWPAEFETCQYDHFQCCSLKGKCKNADAERCQSLLFWT